MSEQPKREDYPRISSEKLRYADTDRLGHVNNTVFAMLFEAGYVELFYGDQAPKADSHCVFRIARLAIEFVGETIWPGGVEIGIRVGEITDNSVELEQAMFQEGRCVATAKSVVIAFDTSKSCACSVPSVARQHLSQFVLTS
jgi:acyl-CoA thioester hydrolase